LRRFATYVREWLDVGFMLLRGRFLAAEEVTLIFC
jgi:hypothetical protein